MISVYNSLSRKKEEFVSQNSNDVKMYACGITPYDECHLGHAMQAVVFDTIRRYLEYRGYKVTYVRNFTDIDDKIINKGQKENKDPLEISKYYISESKKDLAALKVRPANFEPLVSEHIPEIISFIDTLIKKEYAYQIGNSVYFNVPSFKGYGKLSGRNQDEMMSEEGDGKKFPGDFALWKGKKGYEPSWDSPWGQGRPGWHIECSVLAYTYLGETLDIHGGGVDIIFPHHENEIAQSEALTGKQFAKYWLHNGLVMVGKQKMSKSLGNFYTIKQAIELYGADVLRYMILSFSYNSNMNFETNNFISSEKRVNYFYSTLIKLNSLIKNNLTEEMPVEEKMRTLFNKFDSEFHTSMDDNFNTAKALALINDLFTNINNYMDRTPMCSKATLNEFLRILNPLKVLFNLVDENPIEYINNFKNRISSRIGVDRSNIDKMIKERNEARLNKDFTKADDIRNELTRLGVSIMDGKTGTDWY